MLTEECRSSQKVEGVPTPMEVNDDSEPSGYPALVLAEERDDEELIAEHEYTNRMVGPCNDSYAEVGKIKASPNRKSAPRLPKDPTKPPRRPGPKPKFNAIAAAERAAVSAVESQLCGPLREDGPPLGFEFDPLPPRAFQEFLILEGDVIQLGNHLFEIILLLQCDMNYIHRCCLLLVAFTVDC